MDKDFRKIIKDAENSGDRLCDEARQSAREAERKAAADASDMKETGLKSAREKAAKIISDAEEKASLSLSESRKLWEDDVNQLRKATWATSEEAASIIVGKVINL